MNNILIIGGGGREHALAWKIKQSPLCFDLFIAPGNPGTSQLGTNIDINIKDFKAIKECILQHQINMVVIGPEEPLVNGLTDYLESQFDSHGLKVIGPTKEAAQLEGSKAYAKKFMMDFGIPTAAYRSFNTGQLNEATQFVYQLAPPIVVKADGLAAGKGVVICPTHDEAIQEIKAMFDGRFGDSGACVVIEEFLKGREFSMFVLTDGNDFKILPIAKDYKKIGAGDTGPNTGGMGAISPVPFVTDTMYQKVVEKIVQPTIKGIRERQLRYQGFVFIGLIEVNGEPYVIEYNCRMGDPETEVVMPRLESDLVALMIATVSNTLGQVTITETKEAAATVMLVSGGYPGEYIKNKEISINIPEEDGFLLFHAGTKMDNKKLVTNGGRVLAVTHRGISIQDALARSYKKIEHIQYEHMNFRKDIGFDI